MANNKTKATKLYVGKLFSLKKSRRINYYPGAASKYQNQRHQRHCLTSEELGNRVLILNEGSNRVEILPMSAEHPKPVWIAKFFLHSEIKEEIEGNAIGELGKILTELSLVQESLKCCNSTTPQANMKYVEKSLTKIRQVIRRTRVVCESLENET